MFRFTFFLICKKKVSKKKQTSLGSLTACANLQLCAYDELIKIKTQVCLILPKTVELSKISCYFYKFIPKYVHPSNIPLAVRRISLFQNITVRKHNITCRRQISLRISFRGNTLNFRLSFRVLPNSHLLKKSENHKTRNQALCAHENALEGECTNRGLKHLL